MISKPMNSVVMPCYNEQANIARAIQCILDQTYRNFELIVIDDCSTDESAIIIKKFSKTDNRVIYYRNSVNSGVAVSLNNGLQIAKGTYIARMDSDDTCEKERFEKQISYLENHSECVLCGTFGDVYNGKFLKVQGNITGNLKRYLVKNNPFIHSSVMFRRVIQGQLVLYPETKGFEDYALWIELSKKGTFCILPEVLVHRVDIDNLGTKKTWEGFDKLKIYKKLRAYQGRAIKATGYWIYGVKCILVTELKIIGTLMKMIAHDITGKSKRGLD